MLYSGLCNKITKRMYVIAEISELKVTLVGIFANTLESIQR